jgi:hypothetical protein
MRRVALSVIPSIISRLPSCADVSPHATPEVLVLGPIMLTT